MWDNHMNFTSFIIIIIIIIIIFWMGKFQKSSILHKTISQFLYNFMTDSRVSDLETFVPKVIEHFVQGPNNHGERL